MKRRLLEELHPDITISLNNLARLYDVQGRYQEAEELHLDVLDRWKEILGNEHPYIASTFSNLGGTYQEQGRYLESEQKYLEALAMRKRLLGEEHPDIASGLDNLAELYLIQGRYLLAEQKALEAYSLRKKLFSSEQFDIVDSVNYPNPLTRSVWASVLTGECLSLDFRPSFGLISPPTAETAEPSAFSILIPSDLIFIAAFYVLLKYK